MLFLLSKAASEFPVNRDVRGRATALGHYGNWHNLIEHGTYGLISAERSHLPRQENNERTHGLYHNLIQEHHEVVPATGYYGGHPEQSFFVAHPDPEHLHRYLEHLANHFQQESYIVRHQGKHRMAFPNGSAEHAARHHLEGTQLIHHPPPREDRTLMHTAMRHNYGFRMADFFEPGHGPYPGLGKSAHLCPGHTHHPRHAFIVLHTSSGPKRFSLHFEAEPHDYDKTEELYKAFAPPTLQARRLGAEAHDWQTNHPGGAHELYNIANEHTAAMGLPRIRPTHLSGGWRTGNGLSPETGTRIANAYESAKHDTENPTTQRAYAALRHEVRQQHNLLLKHGYKIEPWTKPGQPYKTAEEMTHDVHHNKHIYYFKSAGDSSSPTHKLFPNEDNDKFRAVHDVFGHAMGGNKFGPRPSHGETHAFLHHYQMFSPLARRAMATETLGQNSWFNFSKHNEGKPVGQRDFARQKATLLSPSLYRPLLKHTGLVKALQAMGLFGGGDDGYPENYGFCPAHPNRRHLG